MIHSEQKLRGLMSLKIFHVLFLAGLSISIPLAAMPGVFAMQSNAEVSYAVPQARIQSDVNRLLYSLRAELNDHTMNQTFASEVSTIQTEAHHFVFLTRSLYGQSHHGASFDNTLSQLQDLSGTINFTFRSMLHQHPTDASLANDTSSFASDSSALLFQLRKSST
jgi:hypothetical protein